MNGRVSHAFAGMAHTNPRFPQMKAGASCMWETRCHVWEGSKHKTQPSIRARKHPKTLVRHSLMSECGRTYPLTA